MCRGERTHAARAAPFHHNEGRNTMPLLTPALRAANALKRLERTLRNWQDDPDSPRSDVDKMLAIVHDLQLWVQGHVLAEIEGATGSPKEQQTNAQPPPPSSPPEPPPLSE